jgi:hypothetical protein
VQLSLPNLYVQRLSGALMQSSKDVDSRWETRTDSEDLTDQQNPAVWYWYDPLVLVLVMPAPELDDKFALQRKDEIEDRIAIAAVGIRVRAG